MVDSASFHDDAPLRGVAIRQATVADIPDLVRLRRVIFESKSLSDPAELDAAEMAWETYFAEAIPAEVFQAWLAVTPEGEVVSACGVVIKQHPPTPGNLSGRIGHLVNIVTIPGYRRRGLARRVTEAALKWLDERGVQRVTLHATEVGQSLYSSLGFESAFNEMQLEKKE